MNLKDTLLSGVKILSITFIAWLALDQFIRITGLGSVLPEHYSKQNEQRLATPYIEFRGAPNKLDHDSRGYRWVPDSEDDNALKISFFGGSTGYQGEPPIPVLLERKLAAQLDIPVQVANFSVVSSNHRQHLHNIIESRTYFQPDIVIFYGGYNETLQSAYYDPRPGYPYNYYYRNETSPLRQFLLRYSPTVYMIEEVLGKYSIGSITSLSRLRREEAPMTPDWNSRVIDKYMDTLSLASNVAQSFPGSSCKQGNFFFFYQPYQVPPDFHATHATIRERVTALEYGFDISDAFEKRTLERSEIFTDIVHVAQEGREAVADEMHDLLIQDERFRSCLTDSGANP